MYAYHVATDRPMEAGQSFLLDEAHPNGVGRRVRARMDAVWEIYAHPERWDAAQLEHHTSVALRELALEEVRRARYPEYPSRMGCLYVSRTLQEALYWGEYFAGLGRPTYSVVRLRIEGKCFVGNAARCFPGQTDRAENLRLAELYWANPPLRPGEASVEEVLVDGRITALEIVRRIDANLD